MTSHLLLPLTFVFHAALLTCEKPAPTVSKNKAPDTTNIIIEDHEFYDNMPNAFEGMEMIMVPADSMPTDMDVLPLFPDTQPAPQK